MKYRLLFLSCLSVILVALAACSKDEGSDTPLYLYDSIEYDANRKILITYFSWGGNTQHLAEEIANMTGGTLKYRRSGELVANDSYHTITRWQYC